MGGNDKTMDIIDCNENIQKLKIDDLKIGMIVAETIKISKKSIISKNDTITNDILELFKIEENIDEICVYKSKKYYNADFEHPDDESAENNISLNNSINKKNNNKRKSIGYTVDTLEVSFTGMTTNLNKAFYKLGRFKESNIEEIRQISKQIQEKMTDINIVINNIVFYGSGKDTIYRHCINVAVLSNLLGKWIGLEEKKIHLLTYSALLHDLGKTKIDSKIFETNESLSKEEYKEVKSHPILGYNIVKDINFLDKSVAQGILMHHERIDGSGYPFGLKNDKISEFGKIIAIADVFDAINSNRSYRKKMPPFESLQILKKESYGKLDYTYSSIFLQHMFNYYVGKDVVLNNNNIAQIIQMDINDLDRPLILIDNNFIKLSENKDLDIKEFVL